MDLFSLFWNEWWNFSSETLSCALPYQLLTLHCQKAANPGLDSFT
jgi:hypothetical protein